MRLRMHHMYTYTTLSLLHTRLERPYNRHLWPHEKHSAFWMSSLSCAYVPPFVIECKDTVRSPHCVQAGAFFKANSALILSSSSNLRCFASRSSSARLTLSGAKSRWSIDTNASGVTDPRATRKAKMSSEFFHDSRRLNDRLRRVARYSFPVVLACLRSQVEQVGCSCLAVGYEGTRVTHWWDFKLT